MKTPPFISAMKRPAPQAAVPGNGGGGHGHPDKKKQKIQKDRGNRIENTKIFQELKVPAPLTYEKVFHPHIRYKVETADHQDGTAKCNNYHHRGWCWDKGCKYSGSHGKSLCEAEVVL